MPRLLAQAWRIYTREHAVFTRDESHLRRALFRSARPAPDRRDNGFPGIDTTLSRLIDQGLGPAIGLPGDPQAPSAAERSSRLGPEELGRRLKALYTQHYDSFVHYATRILDNRQDAEDAVNEAFARVLRADPHLDTPEALPSYLRVVVRNETFRKAARKEIHNPVDLNARLASPDRPLSDRVFDEITLAVGVGLLTERQRQCLTLQLIEGLSPKEIAARLQISEGQVKRISHDAHARLAAAFTVA